MICTCPFPEWELVPSIIAGISSGHFPTMNPMRAHRANRPLRRTLRCSQQEAVASAVMTATGDNFFNAFAVHLQATAPQISLLTAIPQFVGALAQMASVWLTHFFRRKSLVVATAVVQGLVVFLISGLAMSGWQGGRAMRILIILAVCYHAASNIIQPHWRAWMGGLVPPRRRGVFFAARTRLTMATSLMVFLGGGSLLTLSDNRGMGWMGFMLLFGAAGIGRWISARLLGQMHDPTPHPVMSDPEVIVSTWQQCRLALRDKTFRNYSLFVAAMQGTVAISAPFFAVYMLDTLRFSYLQYSLNSVASIAIQFMTLGFWGRISDRFGNRLVMLVTSSLLPLLPALWLVSADFYYLIGVQVVSGVAWGGFTLSTANYLYDIRPRRSNFATYAAMQSALGASLVFVGALAGGWVVLHADTLVHRLSLTLSTPLLVVFICSALMRVLVALWFLPRIKEPRVRQRPQLLQIVFRVARFNSVSGMVLDWLTVTRVKKPDDNDR